MKQTVCVLCLFLMLLLAGERGFGQEELPQFKFHSVILQASDLKYAPRDDIIEPAVIATEGRLEQPLGKYYLYYAPHDPPGGICLAYADKPEGPWHEYEANEGLIGACECDTISTITMVAMTTLTKGRPGYISDPVLDVASKQIIYAHCVASNKVFGPNGPSNPFSILTHSEDRSGASLRSTFPIGYMTTSLEMHPVKKQILFHQAKAVANSTEDRACRTKLCCVPVGDFEKLFTQWDQWGWHRVTYYGDLKEPVFDLADALGWKVVEEA